jgi:subtilisin family serine protease
VERARKYHAELGEVVSWTHQAEPYGHAFGGVSETGAGIAVGVADNGINCNLPEIGGCAAVHDFTGFGYYDATGHGTRVASVIVAKVNGSGIRGAAPGVTLYGARVADDWGDSDCHTLALGIDWLAYQDVDVINTSIGFPWNEQGCAVLDSVTWRAVGSLGAMIVAAAGNRTGDPTMDSVHTPARLGWVVAAGGVTCSYSKFLNVCGDYAHWDPGASFGAQVDLAAGSDQIHTINPDGSVSLGSGTSYAAPLVTAAAALAMARWPALRGMPFLTREHLKAQTYLPYLPWAYDPTHLRAGILNVLNVMTVDPCSYMQCGVMPEE